MVFLSLTIYLQFVPSAIQLVHSSTQQNLVNALLMEFHSFSAVIVAGMMAGRTFYQSQIIRSLFPSRDWREAAALTSTEWSSFYAFCCCFGRTSAVNVKGAIQSVSKFVFDPVSVRSMCIP